LRKEDWAKNQKFDSLSLRHHFFIFQSFI